MKGEPTLELRQLKYFVEVAKREHISEAADSLHVAQSAVSRQISNLEEELGIPLLKREGRNIKLTPVGKLFAEHAVMALQAIDNAKQKIDEYLDPERGTVRVGFPSSLASHILPEVISAFKKAYPNVSFHLRQGSNHFLINAIKQSDIDLAFIGPAPTRDPDLRVDVLFKEKIVALLPDTHPLAAQTHISLRMLANDSFIFFPNGFILRKLAVDACLQAGFHPSVPFEGEDLDAIKGLVSAGIGVTLLPEVTLYETIPKNTVRIQIRDPEVTRKVGLISPQHRELAPSEKLFYDFVKGYFEGLLSISF